MSFKSFIELQWVTRSVPAPYYTEKKFLQYRVRNIEFRGEPHDWSWSDWEDVPEVFNVEAT